MNNHPNGDQDYGVFEGRITTSGGQTIVDATLALGGVIILESSIRGGGTYKGHLPSADQVENTWEGEYEL